MTNKRIVKDLKAIADFFISESQGAVPVALEEAIKIIEQYPCDDCISRTEVDRLLMDLGVENAYDMPSFWANKGKDFKVIPTKWHQGYQQAIEDFGNRLKELPSVKPQRPQGKWIEQNDTSKHHFGWYYCSNCGAYLMSANGANYCSCCGTEMEDSND